jgi:N-formylglutamate amidohydrolase
MPSPKSLSALRSPESIEGVFEVFRLGGDGPADLLIELPHGATERVHYDAVAARLASPLPTRLEQFFHVNTDFGVPELAFEVAARLAGAAGKASAKGVVVVRALVPRTFIDFNRVIGEADSAPTAPGMTPGPPALHFRRG